MVASTATSGNSQQRDKELKELLEVVQKGYQLHQRVLRPARVVVASAAPPAEGEAQQGSAEPPSGDDAR